MKNLQKTKAAGLILLFFFGIVGLMAQDVTTVTAMNNDISNNLDLEAVASVFGDANDLEDFEKRLNDPDLRISNLDLNLDGYVDYLRVVEFSENNTHLIVIQAVLGDDLFQDVATIEVERDRNGKTYVQVVGDVYMYGPDYIIEPVYVRIPVFFSFFWRPYYRPYWSPYYWGYYPVYYSCWQPYYTPVYRSHVNVYINVNNYYHHVPNRRSHVAAQLHATHRRNDFGRKYPGTSYVMRNRGTQYNAELSTKSSAEKTAVAAERRNVEKATSKMNNGDLYAQKRTSISKKEEVGPTPDTRVAQNKKATSGVSRSVKSEGNKGTAYTENTYRKVGSSGVNNTKNSNKDMAAKSGKPSYTGKSSESKKVTSASGSKQADRKTVNNTKSYSSKSSMSDHSKSYQSKSSGSKSNQKSYAGTSRSKAQQTASKSASTDGNTNKSKTRSR